MIEIEHRFKRTVLFAHDGDSLRNAVLAAIKAGADLTGANLTGADLTWADLTRADLTRANLTWANLTWANLTWANLALADLAGADLAGANLTWANLTGANLKGADLTGADLTLANLTWADLALANLKGADLTRIREDFRAVLSAVPHEVQGLRAALVAGRVDGSTYSGECACLVGTIANVRGCNYQKMPELKPASDRPAERFFLAIGKGQTPEVNPVAKVALGWIDEWLIERAKEAAGR
jgi:uncharacterized protein YjbI with pentapeptide repeats